MQGQRETNASNTSLIDDIYDDIMLNEQKRKNTYNIKDYSIKLVSNQRNMVFLKIFFQNKRINTKVMDLF